MIGLYDCSVFRRREEFEGGCGVDREAWAILVSCCVVVGTLLCRSEKHLCTQASLSCDNALES
jgi:hypothetical protein